MVRHLNFGKSQLLMLIISIVSIMLPLCSFASIKTHPLPTKSSSQPYKYSGKELDTHNGLNLYDFHARQQDPYALHFTTIDPLAEINPDISPYVFCAANPINIIDPTGLNPIYNRDGKYLGCTNEGFTGDVYIYSGDDEIDFSSMSLDDAITELQYNLTSFDAVMQSDNKLETSSQSAIWTHIVSQFEGMEVYDETFSMSQVQGGKIGYEKIPDANWETTVIPTNPDYIPKIVGTGIYKYETTVENIASSVIVHEWYSHGKKCNIDLLKSHRLAYKNVINFKRLWDSTTDKYKRFNLEMLLNYTIKETGRNKVDPLYRNLYNKYVKSGSGVSK